MKTVLRSVLLLSLFAWVLAACSKSSGGSGGGGGTPPPAAEENLVVTLSPNPPSATTPLISQGASQSISIAIQSKMPSLGVQVAWTYKRDSDGTTISSSASPIIATASPIAITITGLSVNEVGTVEIVVTSRSKPTNTVTKTFKLVRKS